MANRKYYSEYVGHYVRFFLQYPGMVRFNTTQDKKMYESVEEIWDTLTDTEREILKRLYLSRTFAEEVGAVSEEQGLIANSIWKMVFRFEAQIASAGGLI